MDSSDSKSYQLRVRVTAEERDLLEQLRLQRDKGETLSDLVREAISLLTKSGADQKGRTLTPQTKAKVEQLAVLLKRQPQQVEEACIEGIVDLIESKCDVPLIVMETHLHMKYRSNEERKEGALSLGAEIVPKPALLGETSNEGSGL